MIQDKDTNIVYFSEWLNVRHGGYPGFFKRLTALLDEVGIKWDILSNTVDYWVRDYMPLQLAENDYLKYVYRPDYLYKVDGKAQYITDCSEACAELGIQYRTTDIVIDGGNVVDCGDYIVMTDKVFEENGVSKNDENLSAKLEKVLRKKVLFIPWTRHSQPDDEEADVYGHADGFIKYCGGNKILMTNLRDTYPDEADEMRQVLESHGYVVTEMLFDVPHPDANVNWAYINFLQVGNVIIMPCFGIDEDRQALQYISESFPGCNIYAIKMRCVVYKGGALHCLTWNIRR